MRWVPSSKDLAAILQIVRRCHEEARKHAERMLIELALDDREGRPNHLADQTP